MDRHPTCPTKIFRPLRCWAEVPRQIPSSRSRRNPSRRQPRLPRPSAQPQRPAPPDLPWSAGPEEAEVVREPKVG